MFWGVCVGVMGVGGAARSLSVSLSHATRDTDGPRAAGGAPPASRPACSPPHAPWSWIIIPSSAGMHPTVPQLNRNTKLETPTVCAYRRTPPLRPSPQAQACFCCLPPAPRRRRHRLWLGLGLGFDESGYARVRARVRASLIRVGGRVRGGGRRRAHTWVCVTKRVSRGVTTSHTAT